MEFGVVDHKQNRSVAEVAFELLDFIGVEAVPLKAVPEFVASFAVPLGHELSETFQGSAGADHFVGALRIVSEDVQGRLRHGG